MWITVLHSAPLIRQGINRSLPSSWQTTSFISTKKCLVRLGGNTTYLWGIWENTHGETTRATRARSDRTVLTRRFGRNRCRCDLHCERISLVSCRLPFCINGIKAKQRRVEKAFDLAPSPQNFPPMERALTRPTEGSVPLSLSRVPLQLLQLPDEGKRELVLYYIILYSADSSG